MALISRAKVFHTCRYGAQFLKAWSPYVWYGACLLQASAGLQSVVSAWAGIAWSAASGTALFASTVHSWTSLVIVLKWPSCTWSELVHSGLALGVTSNDQLWPCSTMLRTSVNTFDNMWCQTWPDATKCGYAVMAGTVVSDLWGCQSKITQIHVFYIKAIFKRCVSRDHNMP